MFACAKHDTLHKSVSLRAPARTHRTLKRKKKAKRPFSASNALHSPSPLQTRRSRRAHALPHSATEGSLAVEWVGLRKKGCRTSRPTLN